MSDSRGYRSPLCNLCIARGSLSIYSPVVGEEAVEADSECGEGDTPDVAVTFVTPDEFGTTDAAFVTPDDELAIPGVAFVPTDVAVTVLIKDDIPLELAAAEFEFVTPIDEFDKADDAAAGVESVCFAEVRFCCCCCCCCCG